MFKVKNLVFKYPKNTENTIKGIDFEIKQGEVFGFLGPSGAGKTTTQKILSKAIKL
jgi:fluoroquinolone transport system ATP-binding protein